MCYEYVARRRRRIALSQIRVVIDIRNADPRAGEYPLARE